MAFVLDASATLPWGFKDEATGDTNYLLSLARAQIQIYVPAHWPIEVLNGLTRAARRGRIDEVNVNRFLDDLGAYVIAVDAQPISEQWSEAYSLIRKHHLSAYDAAYLALAIRLNVELATLDDQLRLAAIAEGVPLAI